MAWGFYLRSMRRHYLFLLTDPQRGSASQLLAMVAAASLPAEVKQVWLSFEDSSDKHLLEQTLLASDVVIVGSVRASHCYKQYFARWPVWCARSDIDYRAWMQGKVIWAALTGGENRVAAQVFLDELSTFSCTYAMQWGGSVWTAAEQAQAVLADIPAGLLAQNLFRSARRGRVLFSGELENRKYLAACQCEN